MTKLTHEERHALSELCEARDSGLSVPEFVNRRLYSELSHVAGVDRFGEKQRVEHPGYVEQRQAYDGLVEKGLLEGSRPNNAPFYWYGDLTGAGRCYFADEASAKEAERKKVRSDRAHDYRVALFSIVAGAIAGALSSFALHGFGIVA